MGSQSNDLSFLRALAERQGVEPSDKDIEAVDVCTPNSLHAPNTLAALHAGKHVLVEKPMAMNAREAQQMVDAAKKVKKQLIVGFQHRFEPKSKMIRDQINADSFGKCKP